MLSYDAGQKLADFMSIDPLSLSTPLAGTYSMGGYAGDLPPSGRSRTDNFAPFAVNYSGNPFTAVEECLSEGRKVMDAKPPVRAKRQQVSRACKACRTAKAKCTETRPCPRCVRLNCADACVDENNQDAVPAKRRAGAMVTAGQVDRPIPFRGVSFVFKPVIASGRQPIVPVDLEWCRGVLRRGLEIGYEVDRMMDMMRALPQDCLQVFQDACEAIEMLTKARSSQLQLSGPGDDQFLLAPEFVEQVRPLTELSF